MDTNGQTTLAQANDPAIAARIVKGIAELEHDFRLAEGPLSARLIRDIEETMRKAAPEPWEIITTDWSVLLGSPDWKSTRGLGKGDAWFEISEIAADDQDHTWISAAVGAGNTQLGLELNFRKGLQPAAEVAFTEKSQVATLEKVGLKKDDSGERLFLPIAIDKLRLAKGYSENDLTDALLPVRKAVEAVTGNKTELDKLIAHVRQKGKGK